ncbi:MAG: RelA/SpoT domain-containing protein [Azonexus sp.]|jgi:ppGpp synthetase/RelA/SpoT-type nucleotidyltranferase|uniref:GTP pyrophosphokinase n=1 Tax=Azonexus sp. TaxID=1872668 RepID=UPI002839B591|nr:RelA/SpoT domain-containing protein [Azonexus sp.]MDR0776373.1 RelA/SpoT domain-containing protein [Azonexus sp.]
MEERLFDFDGHRELALAQFREVRGLYEDLVETVKRVLRDALTAANVTVHSVEARVKSLDSFANKASKPSPLNLSEPNYRDPLKDITDLAAARVITFLPGVVEQVCRCIESEFVVLEKTDKSEELMDEGRFGYQSIHFLVQMAEDRIRLPEYKRFSGLILELQVRTILQHAWAEMEHDIQYKSASVIPVAIRRRFIALAGMLEIADREFQALQEEDSELRNKARTSVESGYLYGVEITPDSLKAYLDKELGADGRQTDFSYQISAQHLRKLGFASLEQIDECLCGYDNGAVSRALWGNRQGQLSRFEDTLLAAMGEVYATRHPWAKEKTWENIFRERLKKLEKGRIKIGAYDPLLSKDSAIQQA